MQKNNLSQVSRIKKKRILLGGAILFLLIVVTAHLLIANNFKWKSPQETAVIDPLTADFILNTKIGQKILAYLVCIDLDCFDKLNALLMTKQDAVLPLIQLLQFGAPEGIPELANGVSLERISVALGKFGDTRAVYPLIDILKSPYPLERAHAAAALGQIGSNKALPHLIVLLKDKDQFVREMTVLALKNLGRKEALPSLKAALASETYPHLRKALEEVIRYLQKR